MIRLTVQDGHGAIQLFDENQADHLMGECHLAQCHLLGCDVIDSRTEAIRAANDKHQPFRNGVHLLLHVSGKLQGGELPAFLVQQHHVVAGLQRFQDKFAFTLFLLCLGEVLRVLDIRNDLHVKRDVVGKPVPIGVDGFCQIGGVGLADNDQCYFHFLTFHKFRRQIYRKKYIPLPV